MKDWSENKITNRNDTWAKHLKKMKIGGTQKGNDLKSKDNVTKKNAR